jgi:DNA polymerase elongation subunit (family B)
MRIEGWLLDVRQKEDEVILWVKSKQNRVKLRYNYNPNFYFLPTSISVSDFLDLFHEHPYISFLEKQERYISLRDSQTRTVLKVSVDSEKHFRSVLNQVHKFGEIFDSELSHTQRFLADHGLIPMGEVVILADEKGVVNSIQGLSPDLRIKPPPFTALCFEVYQNERILSIITYNQSLQKEYCFTGKEEETLRDFLEYIEELDPDLLSSLERDMKTLIKLCQKHREKTLGKFQKKNFQLTYGRIFIGLNIYRRTSLAGIVERIMYTREVPRIGSEYAAGRAIESRQCYEARRAGYLLPKRGFFQPVLNLYDLLSERDHGGLIFSPTVGLHENVAALDFESMFPHLIIKNNISYENISSTSESEGFLLEFTRDTLERRLYFKHHRKEVNDKPDEWFWCETRQQALKEILFCTYGYSGCWANKFGNMETFMEINKAARENLVQALNLARDQGFLTLYGNCDSLFLMKEGASRKNYEELASFIKKEIGLPIAVENHFKYLVLLPQKTCESFGAINRYYGIRHDDKIICRGIEVRRRNTPKFIAETQKKAIYLLLNHGTKEEVLSTGIKAVQDHLQKASSRLQTGKVPLQELESKTILRRKPSNYKAKLPHVAAAEALTINKSKVEKGSVIRYVYVESGHANPFRRVSPAGFQRKFDYKKYVQLLEESINSILIPFTNDSYTSKVIPLDNFFTP